MGRRRGKHGMTNKEKRWNRWTKTFFLMTDSVSSIWFTLPLTELVSVFSNNFVLTNSVLFLVMVSWCLMGVAPAISDVGVCRHVFLSTLFDSLAVLAVRGTNSRKKLMAQWIIQTRYRYLSTLRTLVTSDFVAFFRRFRPSKYARASSKPWKPCFVGSCCFLGWEVLTLWSCQRTTPSLMSGQGGRALEKKFSCMIWDVRYQRRSNIVTLLMVDRLCQFHM